MSENMVMYVNGFSTFTMLCLMSVLAFMNTFINNQK